MVYKTYKFNTIITFIEFSGFFKSSSHDRVKYIHGCEIATIGSDQGPAFGAAIMAGVGTGIYKSIPEACDAVISVVERTQPDDARVKEYNEYYEIYHSVYPGIRETCHALSKKVSS